jgi:tetratricopeptide (TPR) repeat protein
MLSAWYSRRANDHLKAAAIAEAAESAWGPFRRRVHLPESHLVFDFYLNLWTVYYRVFDEEKFRRLDAWIWKRLAAKPNGQYDSYVLARFLGLFLELQREFPTAEDRLQYFPRRWTVTKAGKRPIRDNLIEKLTRTERISGSFLDQFLANPDKLNQNNALVLARLYLDLGSALWAQSRTKRLLTDGEGSVGEEKDQLAESYMMRAERIFEQGGFRLDLAQAHAVIGGIYADRLRLAQKAGDAIQATEQCKIAIRWFQVAAADFKAVDARKEAAAAWESYAGIERRWLMYQPDRLFPAIAAYEQLLSMPAAPDQAGNRDAHRLTLVQLYQLAGRLEDAARTLNQMDVCSREVVRRRALIHAAMLLLGSVSITPANEAEFEHDLEVLTVEQSAVSMTRDAAIGQIQEPSDAVGVIAWYLTGYLGQQDGAHALRTLRSTHDEVMRTSVLAGQVRDHLPLLLATMWQMSGAADAEMIQDFSTMVLPLVGAETSGAVNQMLDAVWEWEARRGGPLHLAAPGMSLMLCEARLESGGGAKDNCVIARGVFQRLIALGAWDNRDFTGLVARSLAIMVHSGAPERDDSAARGDLTKLLEDLKSAGLYNAALQILVDIVEMLLSAHKSTQNQWFYDIVKALAPELKPIQERSENNFVEVTRLINVYLQLPSGVADAVALMEKQCEHLLESKDYALLPSYLSFLSDLLGDVLRKESFVDRLLRAIADKADPSLDEADVKALAEAGGKASSRTEAVRAVTRDLCGRIIADLSRQPIKRESMQRVLYNAAKLLRQDEAPGLQAAIYIKLYEIADEADGSSAWAAYVAWSGTEDRPAILSLRDCVALTSYSNDNEDASGKVIGSHRNYLINARTRNLLIHSLAEEDQADPSLAVMYAIFELKRLGFLQAFIARLQEFLRGQNEFLRMQVVTFLYDYLFPGLEGAPLWQKLQKIENERGNLRHQMMPFIETLRQHGATAGQNSLDGIEEKLSFTVQTFLLSNRMRGRAIMHELTERLSLFTLENILDEVQRHLNGKEPTVDFGAILGLWPEDEEKVSSEDSDIEAFLKRDPATLVPPLTLTGFRLIQQGEFVTAERVYRYALRLCEGQGGDEFDATPSVLRGLMESLSEQEKFADARDVAIRLAGILESRSHPDLADVLEQLATILESNHQMPEALPYLRRKLELDRVRRGQDTLGFAVDLNNFSQFLRKVGNLAEAEEGMRQAVAIDKEGRELSDPIIPHRLYNLAVVLLLEGKLDEAEEHIERAWLLKPYPVDLTAARVAFIRLVLALLRGKETALYIGQLKTLLRSDEPLQPSSNILRASFLTDVVDDVARRVSPEAGEMIAAVAAAINDDTYIERLGELPAWRDLPSIPIETPWPPIQRGAKAYS